MQRLIIVLLKFIPFFLLWWNQQCTALVPGHSSSSRRTFIQTATGVVIGTATTTATVGGNTNSIANAAATNALSSIPPPVPGSKAPTFELPNSRGAGEISLSKLISTGKWTVLYFYPGAFTTGCTLEARNFQRDIERYRTLNAQIVGVSVDPPEKNAQFCSAEGLDFYMLSDTGGRVSKLYGTALSIPGFGTFSNRQTYIIDPKGDLRWIFTDVESRIPIHSGEVIAKLQELEGINTKTETA